MKQVISGDTVNIYDNVDKSDRKLLCTIKIPYKEEKQLSDEQIHLLRRAGFEVLIRSKYDSY